MKRIERGIAIRIMILIPLLVVSSASKGPLRWAGFLVALAVAASVFWQPRQAQLERLTLTISEYQAGEGHLRIAGVLANSGALDVYRPELRFRLEDAHGTTLASRSVWPTGQIERIFSAGASVPFSLTLAAPESPERARLSIASPQYPLALIMTCDQTADVPPLRAI